GRDPRLVSHHALGALWAPSGRLIAYTGNVVGTGATRISIVDLRTKTVDVLGTSGLPVAWSPDSTRLAYLRNGRLHLIGPDARGGRDLGAFRLVSWSPDGRRLALVVQGYPSKLFVARGDGSRIRRLVTRVLPYVEQVAWSTDGKTLAAVVRTGRGAASVRTIDAGTGATRVIVPSR